MINILYNSRNFKMALIYFINVTKPNNVTLYPPALTDWATNVLGPVISQSLSTDNNGSVAILSRSESELTTLINSIKLDPAQQAQFDEWKTANGISVSYEILDLGNTVSTAIKPF